MDTGQLLDLFGKQAPPAGEAGTAAGQQALGPSGVQAAAKAPAKATGEKWINLVKHAYHKKG